MLVRLTDEQRRAVEFEGNVAVSAGAGSGKTRVLVEKYLRLLTDEHPDWSVDSVVAITFTIKAAAELKARIVKRIEAELALPELDDLRRSRLRHIGRLVGGAPIGTIHGFCGRLLRQFPLEAEMLPEFEVIDSIREIALRQQAVEEALGRASQADEFSEDLDALLLLRYLYRPGALQKLLIEMLGRRTEFLGPASHMAESSEEDCAAELEEFHRENRKKFAEDSCARLCGHLKEFLVAAPGVGGDIKAQLRSLQERGEDCDYVELFASIAEQWFTKKFTLLAKVGKKYELSGDLPSLLKLAECCKQISKMPLGDLTEADWQGVRISRALARFFLNAHTIFAGLKHSQDGHYLRYVDFADLELQTSKLLSNPYIKAAIQKQYHYLIVDEFQDTSELQWSIVEAISNDKKSGAGRLFVVGDEKQGVYGFRQASSTLFQRVKAQVAAANQDRAEDGNVSIQSNFRTTAEPLEWINQIFRRVIGMQENRYAINFEPLKAERKDCAGAVRCLHWKKAEDSEDDTDELTETQYIAAYIAARVQSGTDPSDIAILLRKRSYFDAYFQALERVGIEVSVYQGDSLFQRAEIQQLIHAMRAVATPHNDLVLATFFRGPFLNFTDDMLMALSLAPGATWLEKLEGAVADTSGFMGGYGLSDRELGRYKFAWFALTDLREQMRSVSVDVFAQGVCDRLNVRYILGLGSDGSKRLANVDKFLAVAENAPTYDYHEFLEFVAEAQGGARGESQAELDEQARGVQIMTIHAAKGLEFPIVILPQLNSGIKVQLPSVYTDGEKWLAVGKGLRGDSCPTYLQEFLKDELQNREQAEQRRVLYVAMTRCRDELILSAETGGRKVGPSFYDWIEPEFLMSVAESDLQGRLKLTGKRESNRLQTLDFHKTENSLQSALLDDLEAVRTVSNSIVERTVKGLEVDIVEFYLDKMAVDNTTRTRLRNERAWLSVMFSLSGDDDMDAARQKGLEAAREAFVFAGDDSRIDDMLRGIGGIGAQWKPNSGGQYTQAAGANVWSFRADAVSASSDLLGLFAWCDVSSELANSVASCLRECSGTNVEVLNVAEDRA